MRRGSGTWARSPLGRLLGRPVSLGGLLVAGVAAVAALAAPLLPLADPAMTRLDARLLPPLSPGHWLGTDQLGRDLLARLVWGARLSLGVALIGTTAAAVAGTIIGLVAGYSGGRVDGGLMRGIDVVMAFPYLLLALAIVAVLGPGLSHAVLAIAVVNVPFFARTVRGAATVLRQREFIAAARISGLGEGRILATELFPNVAPTIVVAMSTSLGWMLLETAGLSFLGLGAQPPAADLGGMLGEGRHLMATAPHVALVPGAAIFTVVVALNLVGDGLRDVLDPRSGETARRSGVGGSVGAASSRIATERDASRTSGLPPLSVEALCVQFEAEGGVMPVLHGISFEVRAGEAVGLVGESGSGKTVTALSVLGLLGAAGRVTGGRIRHHGRDLVGASPEELQRLRGAAIGYVPQDPMASLHPLMPVGRQIAECVTAHGGDRRSATDRAIALLRAVRIADPARAAAAYPHELSGGMRQRVAIAMALANDPALLIADEPTTALDVTIQAEILELLEDLTVQKQTALLFISHDLAVVSQICGRVVVLRGGHRVEEGATEELLHRPRHPYTVELLASVPRPGATAAERWRTS